jgi:hypothetical protein
MQTITTIGLEWCMEMSVEKTTPILEPMAQLDALRDIIEFPHHDLKVLGARGMFGLHL